jgi:phosphoribosylamine--glycine ligase
VKVIFVSKEGASIDLAYRIQEEGNDVKFYIKGKDDQGIGRGVVPIITTPTGLNTADLVVMDDVGFGGLADGLRKSGKAVIGGSKITDQLENDRFYENEEFEKAGMKVPHAEKFTNFEKAAEYIKERNKKVVFKPYGQKQRFLTHCGKDTEEMIAMMKHFKKMWVGPPTFVIQDFVEGIECAVGGWFNGTDFVDSILPNFEHKKLFPDEMGPNTGEMGTVMMYRPKGKLYDETLGRLIPLLTESGYKGYFDLNCILTEKGAFILEATSRFGYPTIEIQDELQSGGWSNFLLRLAQGKAKGIPAAQEKWAVGVCVVCLPWPMTTNSKQFKGGPVFLPDNLDHIHLGEVMKDSDGQWHQDGQGGHIVVCTGSSEDLKEAKEKAYKVVDKVHVPSGFWRMDISDKVLENFSTLKSWGWWK